ncbi:MAG: hypothetical protein K2K45_07605 [Muribaculaceae bacterium]|nr:hypothetical protein [Muribaculaceae bacterium]
MKKIMFNNFYGLNQDVLDGRKTMTRRVITCPKSFKGERVAGFHVYKRQSDGAILEYPSLFDADESTIDGGYILPKYKVGEVVAIAQSYKDAGVIHIPCEDEELGCYDFPAEQTNGWTNKMFVRADLMPHQIQFLNHKVERLQDISDEDCIKEGVVKVVHRIPTEAPQYVTRYYPCQSLKEDADKLGWGITYDTPQKAFAVLIDNVSGEGTWESNPYVFAYEFKLVK